jgi:anthranilate phosphoribosyltransferase
MSFEYKTVTPEEIAEMLGASPNWVREQAAADGYRICGSAGAGSGFFPSTSTPS